MIPAVHLEDGLPHVQLGGRFVLQLRVLLHQVEPVDPACDEDKKTGFLIDREGIARPIPDGRPTGEVHCLQFVTVHFSLVTVVGDSALLDSAAPHDEQPPFPPTMRPRPLLTTLSAAIEPPRVQPTPLRAGAAETKARILTAVAVVILEGKEGTPL